MAAEDDKKRGTKDLPAEAELRKADEAIAIIPQQGNAITLVTRRLFNAILYLSQQQGIEQETYRSPLGEIASTASFGSNDFSLLKEHLRTMRSISVEWNSAGPSGRRWGLSSLLPEVEIIEDKAARRCFIEWSFPPKVKTMLLNPRIYARINLGMSSSLRSTSSSALYDICKRYAESPAGLTNRDDWEWWRPVLTGAPDTETSIYQEYKYFKRNILIPSVREVSAITDIEVELIEHKAGRKVEQIQFRVKVKRQQSLLTASSGGTFDMSIVERMLKLGLNQRDIDKIYSTTEETVIRANLDYTEQRMNRQPKLSSPVAFFKDAIKRGYAHPKDGLLADKTAEKDKPKLSLEKLQQQFASHRMQEAESMFSEMDESTQGEHTSSWMASSSGPVRSSYEKNGLKTKMVRVAFFGWLAQQTWGEPTEADLLEFVLNNQAG